MRILKLFVCAIALASCSKGAVSFLPLPANLPNGTWSPGAVQRSQSTFAWQPRTSIANKFPYSLRDAVVNGTCECADLIDVNGKLYGTGSGTATCKLVYCGIVFELNPSGTGYKSLYNFKGGNDGASPGPDLIAVNGKLYGTTSYGGGTGCNGYGCGTVFELSRSGKERVLRSFKSPRDGLGPDTLIDVNGKLYGTTTGRGANERGTFFELNPSGTGYKTLYNFKRFPNSGSPLSLIAVNGTFYGEGSDGKFDSGSVFEVNISGKESVLHSFDDFGFKDGFMPSGGLIYVNGALYGTTESGGTFNDGTVFSVSTTGGERGCIASAQAARRTAMTPTRAWST